MTEEKKQIRKFDMKKHAKKCESNKCKCTDNDCCNCDGYHTFEELYDHRIRLFITLCRAVCTRNYIWKSKKHSDGTEYAGWFILGIGKANGEQITYHIPLKYWNEANFAQSFKKAPIWDGHTSDDVMKRLKKLI